MSPNEIQNGLKWFKKNILLKKVCKNGNKKVEL